MGVERDFQGEMPTNAHTHTLGDLSPNRRRGLTVAMVQCVWPVHRNNRKLCVRVAVFV